jgi:hypothetical protein
VALILRCRHCGRELENETSIEGGVWIHAPAPQFYICQYYDIGPFAVHTTAEPLPGEWKKLVLEDIAAIEKNLR